MRASHSLMTIHEILFIEVIDCETQALILTHLLWELPAIRMLKKSS